MVALDILSDGFFAAVAGIGFGAISDPPLRAFKMIAILAALGHACRFCLMTYLGVDIATASLFAGLVIGFGSLWLGKRVYCPMTVLYIPALLPMIPGKFAYNMVFSLINMIMLVSPIGVFFLMGDSFGKYGAGIFTSMATLVGTYYLACLVHVVLVYCTVIWVTAGINPLKFLKDSAELWVYTISTCSSVAAIPINIKVAKEKFNVPETISGFTVPLGSQMNYDGSVILYGCVILFISQTIGVPVTLGTMVKIILMSAILSTGGGGIPGSGIVKLLVISEP